MTNNLHKIPHLIFSSIAHIFSPYIIDISSVFHGGWRLYSCIVTDFYPPYFEIYH